MKHGLLPSLLLTALLTTSAPVFAQTSDQSAALVERIAELKKRAVAGVEARAKLA
jgi:aminobenzoyl-glutamate utilization protein B